jgi:hypothetical protein
MAAGGAFDFGSGSRAARACRILLECAAAELRTLAGQAELGNRRCSSAFDDDDRACANSGHDRDTLPDFRSTLQVDPRIIARGFRFPAVNTARPVGTHWQ